MEGLRVSKLEEGQQWGKNTSSKDKVEWGRRPPFIGAPESNRYVLSSCTSGTTAQDISSITPTSTSTFRFHHGCFGL